MNKALPMPMKDNPFPDRRRWTADDCQKLETLGILVPGTYELLDGEVVEKLGQNALHGNANINTYLALTLAFGTDYVMIPISVIINHQNRPEPDVFVTVQPRQFYNAYGNPTHADMRLVVEIADTTLWRDLNTKAVIYGGAGVSDYWVLDINGRRLFVHRQPKCDGYADVQELDETQSIAPLAAPNHPVRVADLLP
jgi:Uma2 family endonuclease